MRAFGEVELRHVHPENIGRRRRLAIEKQALLIGNHPPAGGGQVRRFGKAHAIGNRRVANDAEHRGRGNPWVFILRDGVDVKTGAHETVFGAPASRHEVEGVDGAPVLLVCKLHVVGWIVRYHLV